MQIDAFLDPTDCCDTTVCACSWLGAASGITGKILVEFFAKPFGLYFLLFTKLCGIAFDIIALNSINYLTRDTPDGGGAPAMYTAAFILLFLFFIIDRSLALFMICIYGYSPKIFFRKYAENMEMSGKIGDKQAIHSLYYASLFSGIDFMGQIWKSYTYTLTVTQGNDNNTTNDDTNDNNDGRNVQLETKQIEPPNNDNMETAIKNDVASEVHVSSIICFGICYFFVIVLLTSLLVSSTLIVSILADYVNMRGLDAFVIWLSQSSNSVGMLQHFWLIGIRIKKKCKKGNGGCCCKFCGKCFFVFVLIFGILIFLVIQAILVAGLGINAS